MTPLNHFKVYHVVLKLLFCQENIKLFLQRLVINQAGEIFDILKYPKSIQGMSKQEKHSTP